MTLKPMPSPVQCYWVLTGQLLAGEYPAQAGTLEAAVRLGGLLGTGINTFVDLTEPGELSSYEPLLQRSSRGRESDIRYRRFPIPDFGLPRAADMRATLDYLDHALAEGRRIYLHCHGGVGRTGMTVGCFLVRHGKTGQEALDQLAFWWRSIPKRQYFPRSPETPEQVQFVLSWKEPASTDLA
jgi:hypothetical protein